MTNTKTRLRATVYLLLDTDDPELAADAVTKLLTENGLDQKYSGLSAWAYAAPDGREDHFEFQAVPTENPFTDYQNRDLTWTVWPDPTAFRLKEE